MRTAILAVLWVSLAACAGQYGERDADSPGIAEGTAVSRGGPTPYSMTARDIAAMEEGELAAFESSLQERVRSTLGRSPSIDVDSIDIAVTGDQVLLRGSVPNADQRRLAQEIATTVEGVRSVQNELSVR
jgi:hypothetical protein